ncbi:MAG: HD domain-containing protein [Syntrophobacteraceae bacterium]|nr:HDIG domain-containing protein [Desulfobacteraceae bacterium]
MDQVLMPPHIRRHSMMVAEIALYLARLLNQNSIRLNLQLVEAGALLHDIAKPRSLETGEHHNVLGASMLEAWGYPLLAPIVRDHVTMDDARLNNPITESVLVNYADKRVKHDQVVTIQERFADLVERYGKDREHRKYLMGKINQYAELERRIFEHLAIGPTEPALMAITTKSID